MFETPPDQPQSVGDLLGRAFRVYRPNILLFLKVLIGPTAFLIIGSLGVHWGATYSLDSQAQRGFALPFLPAILTASLSVVLVSKWILTIRQLSFVRIVAGFARDYPSAHLYMIKQRWRVLALCLLAGLLFLAAMAFWMLELALTALLPHFGTPIQPLAVAGVLAGTLGLAASACMVILIMLLVFSVAACEDEPVSVLIGRGISLTINDLGRSLGLGILLLIAMIAISYPLTLPVLCLTLFDMFGRGPYSDTLFEHYRLPFYLLVIKQIWESLVNMLLSPVVFLAYGLFYYDLRLRQEGLDLLRRLEALERAPLQLEK